MAASVNSEDVYPDEETLRRMVFQIDPRLDEVGYYDETGFETNPGLHQKKLEKAQSLAIKLFQIAMQDSQKSQPEG